MNKHNPLKTDEKDPRFRSPDDLLGKIKPKHPPRTSTPRPPEKTEETLSTSNPSSGGDLPIFRDAPTQDPYPQLHHQVPTAPSVMKVLQELKKNHEKELAKWQMYEQQVEHWKERVLEIVKQLQTDKQQAELELVTLKGRQELVDELQAEIGHLKSELIRRKKSPH